MFKLKKHNFLAKKVYNVFIIKYTKRPLTKRVSALKNLTKYKGGRVHV